MSGNSTLLATRHNQAAKGGISPHSHPVQLLCSDPPGSLVTPLGARTHSLETPR